MEFSLRRYPDCSFENIMINRLAAVTPALRRGESARQAISTFWRGVREYATAIIAVWHTPELFDAARKRPARQSSYDASDGAPPLGADGTYPNKNVHPTALEVGPWWIIDLGKAYPIHSIRIANRAGMMARSAAQLTVSVSTDAEHWQVIHTGLTHFGGAASPKPLEIRLLSAHSARYVRLALTDRGAVRVRRVQVFVERKHAGGRRVVRWRRRLAFPVLALVRARRRCIEAREFRRIAAPHLPPLVDVAPHGMTSGGLAAARDQDQPWSQINLGASYPIYAIRIHNRPGKAARLTARLVVSISDDAERWECVLGGVHFFGDPGSPGPLEVRLISSRCARFVKLELPDAAPPGIQRIEVLVERGLIALESAARKYRFVLPDMLPTDIGRPRYTVEGAPKAFDGSLAAFHVTRVIGRFGNQLVMITNAVCIARKLGIERVYLQPLKQFNLAEPMHADGVMLLPQRLLADTQGPVLSGSFYRREAFGEDLSNLCPEDIQWALRNFVRPLFRRSMYAPHMEVTETDLVIHLRAGDIFSSLHPHPGYVQPPLSYYQLILHHARRTLAIRRVVLVYEDDGNPCVGGLKAWLKEIGMPFVAQSASLQEDLSVLLQARSCVFGHGTFGPAIVSLSDRMRIVFSPWTTVSLPAAARAVGVKLVLVRDIAGKYIRSGDWRGTPEQRQVMLDYPIENLAIDEGSSSAGPSGLLPE